MSETLGVAADADVLRHFDLAAAAALEEDLGEDGDITTQAVVSETATAAAVLVAKADGVVCGLPALRATFSRLDSRVEVHEERTDGDRIVAGDVLARITGPARAVLTGERSAINVVGHLSGIATMVRAFAREAPGVAVTETRKTLPGLRALQKYAVRVGGGTNHRVGLWDGILIKDNHIAAAGGVAEAVRRAKAASLLPVEVECTTAAEVDEALDAAADEILLDNRDTVELAVLVARIRERKPGVVIEASGNVSEATIAAVAATGVDRISVGAFTHSAPALDVSLRFERVGEEA